MAFTPIDENDIEVGKPVKKRLFTQIKDNFDDHESRLDTLQAGASKVSVFNFEVAGALNDYSLSELTGISVYEANTQFTLTNVSMILLNNTNYLASTSSGITEIDIELSVDNGVTWTSVLSTRPTIPNGTDSTGYKSNDVVIDTLNNVVSQGDLLRLNVTSLKDNQGSFQVTVYGEL